MRCKHCNTRLADHDVWCVNCGRQTEVPSKQLSAIASMKETWHSLSPLRAQSIPAAAASIIFGVVPLTLAGIVFTQVQFSFHSSNTINLLLGILLKIIVFSVFAPFLLVAFAHIGKREDYQISLKDYSLAMKQYPKYLLLGIVTGFYYALIYLICFGMPSFGSDPILRLVWLVLVNYWMAIILPVPALMEIKQIGVFRAIRLSYRHFHDLRWNLYLMALLIGILTSIATALLLVGLLYIVPFFWFAVRDYTRKLIDFELLEYHR